MDVDGGPGILSNGDLDVNRRNDLQHIQDTEKKSATSTTQENPGILEMALMNDDHICEWYL